MKYNMSNISSTNLDTFVNDYYVAKCVNCIFLQCYNMQSYATEILVRGKMRKFS